MKEKNNVISERVTVSDAAVILGISQNELRANMKRGVLKIGKVIPPKPGKNNYTYIVYKSLLDKFLHKNEASAGGEQAIEAVDRLAHMLLEILGELKEIKTLTRQSVSKR